MRIRFESGLEANVYQDGIRVIAVYDDGDEMIMSPWLFDRSIQAGGITVLSTDRDPKERQIVADRIARIHRDAARILAERNGS